MLAISSLSIEVASSAISLAFSVVALVVATVCVFYPRANSGSIKLLGSVMVLALAFAANKGPVYALAIFIIATLVTDLDFLEKIAALFWNRDKYWEYRLGAASPSQVMARVTNEAQEEAAAETSAAPAPASAEVSSANLSRHVANALSFELSVQEALTGSGHIFGAQKIISNALISTPSGPVEIDAVVETPATDYVIEVKYSSRPHVMVNALHALERAVSAYKAYLRERGTRKNVIPVVIIPADVAAPTIFRGKFLVLKFDPKTGRFVDMEEFLSALRHAWPEQASINM